MTGKNGAAMTANRQYCVTLLFAIVCWGIDTYAGVPPSETRVPIGWTVVPILLVPVILELTQAAISFVKAGRILLWVMFPVGVLVNLPPGMDVSLSAPEWSWVRSLVAIIALAVALLLSLNLLKRTQGIPEARPAENR